MIFSVGGVITYGILFPPVWTEQLAYKNSTGQFQTVTVYRNATDVSYNNLTAFLTANDIEQLVYADTEYRPVEYAALLHDMAESSGINCTVIGSGIVDDVPANAIDAFMTTDQGMVYVDTTAMNVSQGNYTVPFSDIRLLREWWNTPTPWTNYNNQYLTIKTYRDAKPVSYDDLIAFLNRDHTEDAQYLMPTYTCVDFSVNLYNNAEAAGIKCGLVSVFFKDPGPGHAFNAFQTTDKGIVYIDSTGINDTQRQAGYLAIDANVYLQMGSQLGELPDNQTGGDLSYAFYSDRLEKINAYRALLDQYSNDVETYNSEAENYEADVNNYNAQMDRHNSAIAAFNSANTNEYNSYMNGAITYNEYLSWYNTNSAGIPGAPTNGAALDSRKAYLDQQRTSLENRQNELKNAEEAKWMTCNPVGIVAIEDVFWP